MADGTHSWLPNSAGAFALGVSRISLDAAVLLFLRDCHVGERLGTYCRNDPGPHLAWDSLSQADARLLFLPTHSGGVHLRPPPVATNTPASHGVKHDQKQRARDSVESWTICLVEFSIWPNLFPSAHAP